MREEKPGQPQIERGQYFSRKAQEAITTIWDSTQVSSLEIFKRLKAFMSLKIFLGGRWQRITKIKIMRGDGKQTAGLSFQTSDGIMMKPTRFNYFPFSLYWLGSWGRIFFTFLSGQIKKSMSEKELEKEA